MPHTLTREEIAKELGVSIRTIDALIKKKRIPHIRITPRMPRFDLEECRRHFERNNRVLARNAA